MINYPFNVQYCDIDTSIQIAYCDEGKGASTLLFVHGLGNYIPVFKHNINVLKEHARCVAIDLPGNGLSSRGEYPFTMTFYAESIVRFIQQMELSNVVLIGHSMGGHVSLLAALNHTQLIHKLVLLGSSGLEYFTEMEKTVLKGVLHLGSLFYGNAGGLELAIKKSYYATVGKDAEQIRSDLMQFMEADTPNYWQNMIKKNMESMLIEQVFSDLKYLKQETLILFGKEDEFIPNKFVHKTDSPEMLCERVRNIIPTCSTKVLPACGHFVQIEAAEIVNASILEFIQGN